MSLLARSSTGTLGRATAEEQAASKRLGLPFLNRASDLILPTRKIVVPPWKPQKCPRDFRRSPIIKHKYPGDFWIFPGISVYSECNTKKSNTKLPGISGDFCRFPEISRRFPEISRDIPEIFRRLLEISRRFLCEKCLRAALLGVHISAQRASFEP